MLDPLRVHGLATRDYYLLVKRQRGDTPISPHAFEFRNFMGVDTRVALGAELPPPPDLFLGPRPNSGCHQSKT